MLHGIYFFPRSMQLKKPTLIHSMQLKKSTVIHSMQLKKPTVIRSCNLHGKRGVRVMGSGLGPLLEFWVRVRSGVMIIADNLSG